MGTGGSVTSECSGVEELLFLGVRNLQGCPGEEYLRVALRRRTGHIHGEQQGFLRVESRVPKLPKYSKISKILQNLLPIMGEASAKDSATPQLPGESFLKKAESLGNLEQALG